MSAPIAGALYAIEIQPHRAARASERWPAPVQPQPDELLSSWLNRLALAHGLPPRAFGSALGLGGGAWSSRLDLAPPAALLDLLARRTGLAAEAIAALSFRDFGARELLLPLRTTVSPRRKDRWRATWLQACPCCLAEDQYPYFRRAWRLATTIFCLRHARRLIDRCPACGQALVPFDQAALTPQNFCAHCLFDLRCAATPPVHALVRRNAQSFAEFGLDLTVDNAAALKTILRLPAQRDPPRSAAFTALSTRERALCLIDLNDEIEAILTAAGRRPAGLPAPPKIRLATILSAYASVQRRQSYSLKSADGAEPRS
jgi:hypothetical protein